MGVSVSHSELQQWEGSWQAEGLHQQKWAVTTHLYWPWHQFPWKWLPFALEQHCMGQINW